jgi:heme oxygenase
VNQRSEDQPSFAQQVREATWSRHEEAAGAPFLQALFSGTLERERYVAMVGQHYLIYDALEAAADAVRGDEVGGQFVFPELERRGALERDLDALAGAQWRTVIAPAPATERYCARIREVCTTWSGGFVAHHYTRYMGDLSGGQIIRGAVQRAYGLADGHGVRFYEFPALDDIAAFKDDYRGRLDRMPWDDDERSRIIAEMLLAYDHNLAVLTDLEQVTA